MKWFKKACDNKRRCVRMKRAATCEKLSDLRRRKKNALSRRAAMR